MRFLESLFSVPLQHRYSSAMQESEFLKRYFVLIGCSLCEPWSSNQTIRYWWLCGLRKWPLFPPFSNKCHTWLSAEHVTSTVHICQCSQLNTADLRQLTCSNTIGTINERRVFYPLIMIRLLRLFGVYLEFHSRLSREYFMPPIISICNFRASV